MANFDQPLNERELKRWMRPNAHLFLRPDWRRFWKSGHENDPLYRFYRAHRTQIQSGSAAGLAWAVDV